MPPARRRAQPAAASEAVAPEPLPETAAVPPMPPAAEAPPVPSLPAPALPLPQAEPPPTSAQPYAQLASAAERMRDLPAHVEIVYELDGALSGRQTHVWQMSEDRYSLETEGVVTGLAGLFLQGKLIQTSRGRIGPLGLMPEQYEMQHLTGRQERLRFDYEANIIESIRTDARRGTRTLELPLLTGAQDPLSAIYQLALVAQDGKDGFLVAAGAKRVKGYPYRMLGTETLRTPLGELPTLHVVRAGDSERVGIELWLSPAHHFLPVKVSYLDEDGRRWVLLAVSIKTQ